MNSGIIEKDRTVQVLDLTAQYRSIEVEIKTAIERVLTSQHFILGPEGKALENANLITNHLPYCSIQPTDTAKF